jgi:sigma-E factor negative regulatory protein RseC
MSLENEEQLLTEQGVVIAVEADALWVETIQQSTCGTCAAQKGCGQRLLSKMGSSSTQLKVALGHQEDTAYNVGESVTIAIPADTVLKGSFIIYFLPLLAMIVFSSFAHTSFSSEIMTAISGVLGLFVGGGMIRYFSSRSMDKPYLQPILISRRPAIIVSNIATS